MKQPHFSKKYIIIAISFAVVFVAMVSAFSIIFRHLKSNSDNVGGTRTSQVNSSATEDSDSIIKAFTSEGSIQSIGKTYSVTPLTALNQARVDTLYYAKAGSYTTTVTASSSALMTQDDASLQDNNAETVGQVEAFMKAHGLLSVENASTSSKSTLLKLYQNSKTACQTITLPKMKDAAASIGLSCAPLADIDKRYDEISSFLKLYDGNDNPAASAIAIYLETTQQDSMKLSMLRVYLKDESASKRLYFATTGGSLEYIGALPLSPDASGTASSIPLAMQQKINNAKYGDFLKKNIQG